MGVMLVFVCPETANDVPVCVLRGVEELSNLGEHEIKFACLECGGTHRWSLSEGRLALGDKEPAPLPKVARIP